MDYFFGIIGKVLQTVEPEKTLLEKETVRLVRKLALLCSALCVLVVIVLARA
jgi:hypothetical protein